MARGRRGGGPPDLKGTLGTLLRSTLHQVGVVKDAALRGAEAQRVWLDGALLQRKHRDALARLGAEIYERVLSGQLRDLEGDPAVADSIAEIEELEVRMQEAAERARESASRAHGAARRAASSFAARAGFPDSGLGRRREGADDDGELRVWRPVVPDDDDGTVSALAEMQDEPETVRIRPPRRRGRSRPARARRGAGGIEFVDDPLVDDDDDLADYMHPDDVPDVGDDES
jgi:hypothetical protein